MSERIAAKLADIAWESGIISEDDRDLYIYSYQILIERTVSWACILFIALFFGTLYPYALIFAAFYLSLSMFTGGWHAPSFILCFFMSVGVFLGFSLVEPLLADALSINALMIIVAFCAVGIGLLRPAAHPNKPMDDRGMKRCRRVAVVVLILQSFIAFVFFAMGNSRMLLFIAFSFVIVSFSLVIAHCSVKRHVNILS